MSYTLAYKGAEIDEILGRAATGGALDTAIAAKQDALTFDAVPTEGSTNPAESGGIYDAIQAGGAAALAAFATDTVSGDVVSFPDGADNIPVKSFTGSIIPLQSGSGDPAPDNIRPISGWTGANITRAGRNLFNPHPNHNVSAQGEYIEAGAAYWATDYIPIGGTKSVVVSVADLGGMTDGSIVRVNYASDGTVTSSIIGYFNSYTTPWTFTLADNIVGLRFRGYRSGGASPITGAKIQAEFGSTATDYEAYQGETITIDWTDEAGTVYGGTLDVTTGVLTVDKATLTLDGASTYSDFGFNTYGKTISGVVMKTDGDIISSQYPAAMINSWANMPDMTLWAYVYEQNSYVRVRNSSIASAADFKAALAANPIQVVYTLATPITYQLTPAQVTTLLGANTVWTDVGSVTGMTYRADTALYIQKLLNGGGTLSTLSMASPSPSLSLGRVGVLAEPEADAEPEEVTEEPEADTEEATEE